MQKLLGNLKKGLVFVVSAPAGTGKTTLVKMLYNEFPCVVASVSYTTRRPRVNEVNGKDYHFIAKADFEQKIKEGEFLEYAKVYDDYYGTSKKYVAAQQEKGLHVVLVIDTQGALQLMETFPATFIFISPPTLEVLRDRLSHRRSETVESLTQRLSWAAKELTLAHCYDYQIINDDKQIAYTALKSIVIATEHSTKVII